MNDRTSLDFTCSTKTIALFTAAFSHLHYNVFERGCEAISGNFAVSARDCLTSMFKYIVMQTRNVNCEKGYCMETSKENLCVDTCTGFRRKTTFFYSILF